MADTVILQTVVDVELDQALVRRPVAHGMTKDALVADVLQDFVAAETEANLIAQTEEGLRDLREGHWMTHEHVSKPFEERFGSAK